MDIASIPKATLGRIPTYVQYLRELPDESDLNISATKIARGLSLGEVQVRKDLAMISGSGKPRIGYERSALIRDLERHLGSQSLTNAVLVGVGKLGRALLDFGSFEEFGVRIVAGFDCNESIFKISKDKSILPIKAYKPGEHTGGYYEIREVEVETKNGAKETIEVQIDYKIWYKFVD